MIKDISYHDQLKTSFDQLDKAAFLTTKVGDKVNTMTIAWGGISLVWHKKVFVVFVRYTRDTYDMLEHSDAFTVSIPKSDTLKEEWVYCGRHSGRDVDKITECNLTLLPGRQVNVPVIKECETHYECKIIYKQAMEPSNIPDDVKDRFYKKHDYHVMYFGEILDSYQTKE
ncbi:MAG: flavin reductase family protein [Candidatus Izemoplasma sp.]|nr:flavin reductase family protein [Candidatus Izemoplasma sp.]